MTANSNPTQCERVLDHMERHGYITQYEAMNDLGVMRLASRISELRKQGYPIIGERVNVMNRFGETCNVCRYSIAKEA